MSHENSGHFGNSSSPPQDENSSLSNSSSKQSFTVGNPRVGITEMCPSTHQYFGAKPKLVMRSKLPGDVTMNKTSQYARQRSMVRSVPRNLFKPFFSKPSRTSRLSKICWRIHQMN
jgi:hypothetical protein